MSYKSCPDWPALMELAPDLQFKHMTVHDAQLPFEVVAKIPSGLSLDEIEICCDVEHHVVNAPTRTRTSSSPSRARTGSR